MTIHFFIYLLDTVFHGQLRYAEGSEEHSKAGTHLAGGWSAILFSLQADLIIFLMP